MKTNKKVPGFLKELKIEKPKHRFYQLTWRKFFWIGVGFFAMGALSKALEPLFPVGSFWNYCLSVLSWFLVIGFFTAIVSVIEWPRKRKKIKEDK